MPKRASRNGTSTNSTNSTDDSEESGEDVQRKFQKLSGREHILQRSDMYCGSTDPDNLTCYVVDSSGDLSQKDVLVAPAFLQTVEEAIMNAADRISVAHEENASVTHNTTKIAVDIKSNKISVYNDGDGIPCDFLDEHGVHAPELIFGNLRTSSNYDDNEKRLNVGRNGIGIKIANIFSSKFIVETVDFVKKKKYRQIFSKNMSVVNPPVIKDFDGEPYTKVTFHVDTEKFGMGSEIPEDVVSILRRRCYEVLVCSLDPVKVVFNGKTLKANTLEKYMDLYGIDKPRIATAVTTRWKVAVAFTPGHGTFRQISFVNSTCTPQGGTHVNYIVDPLVKHLVGYMRKKFKVPKLKTSIVKDALTIVVSAHVVNPTFSSQTKDMLTLPVKDFGSTFELPESVPAKILKMGLVEYVGDIVKNKEVLLLNENDGKKTKSVKGIPKLHDAQWAGTKKSSECFLIVTEGDSALTMALSAAAVIGREKFGCFPLRGKLLNVRDAPSQQVSNNAEITNIKKILGLQNGIIYDEGSVRTRLRYGGGIILLTDADLDGSHIRGLLLNLFDTFWPSLLELGYVKTISTPIVRATKGSSVKLFYNDFDYKNWKENSITSGYKIKYLKGLGSSTPAEAREYFRNVYKSLVGYNADENSKESMSLAFDKNRSGDRKKWLMDYDSESIIQSSDRTVDISTFVNKELIHFSQGDLVRSMPSVVDGLKLSQRKALCGSFLKGILKTESKVAQLTGFVSDKTQYHHGESSMSGTIVGMAQDFVGTNTINYLLPKGQLGSRLSNGNDAASPRYTFVQMNPVTPLIFKKEDGPILSWTEDEGVVTEPVYYVPVICTLLANGCKSIATGYSTTIHQYNPVELIRNVRKRLGGKPVSKLLPYYRGFLGDVVENPNGGYFSRGVYTVRDKHVSISEIPIGLSISSYKNYLDSILDKKSIASYTERCTDSIVDFDVTLKEEMEIDKIELLLKLTSSIKTTNMHAFDVNGRIKKYEDVSEIEKEHFDERYKSYGLRKEYLLDVVRHDLKVVSEKVRFFEFKIDRKIVLEGKTYEECIQSLVKYKFVELASTFDSDELSFDYITNVKMFDVTKEKVLKLVEERDNLHKELLEIENSTVEDMWKRDLALLEKSLKK